MRICPPVEIVTLILRSLPVTAPERETKKAMAAPAQAGTSVELLGVALATMRPSELKQMDAGPPVTVMPLVLLAKMPPSKYNTNVDSSPAVRGTI